MFTVTLRNYSRLNGRKNPLSRGNRRRGQAQAIAICVLTASILHIWAAVAEVLHWRHAAIAALTELGLATVYLRIYREEREHYKLMAQSQNTPPTLAEHAVNGERAESPGAPKVSVESVPFSEYETAETDFFSEGNPNIGDLPWRRSNCQ